MSYSDKCCGVCKEYQELRSVGFHYSSVFEEPIEDFVRFKESNVCSDCVDKKMKTNIKNFEYSKLTHKVDRSKGWIHYTDIATGVFKRAHASRFDATYQESKEHPWLYEVFSESDGESINIYNRDKRKLRKTLRHLGIVGKIEQIIK